MKKNNIFINKGIMDIKEIYRLLKKIRRFHNLTDDDIQNIVIKVFESPGLFDPTKSNLKTYLNILAKNHKLDQIRKETGARFKNDAKITHISFEVVPDDFNHLLIDNSPEEEEILQYNNEVLHNLLKTLSKNEIEIISLWSNGYTHSDISDDLGISVASSKVRIKRILDKLKKNK